MIVIMSKKPEDIEALAAVLGDNPEESEEFEECETSEELRRMMDEKHAISRKDFNYACDEVVYETPDLSFNDIMVLARFTCAVRKKLFADRKNKKEEK